MIALQFLLVMTSMVCAEPIAKSSVERVAMLELYTSVNCPYCPPADRWMGKLQKHPKLWQSFVPIVFVTGPETAERHKAHARAWTDGALYTPAFVLNGDEWRDWSEVTAPPVKTTSAVGVLSIEESSSGFKVAFVPKNKNSEDLTLNIALLDFDVRKAGRAYDFIVREWQNKFVMRPEKGRFIAEFPMKAKGTGRQALTAWVQQGSAPHPLQATGAYLK